MKDRITQDEMDKLPHLTMPNQPPVDSYRYRSHSTGFSSARNGDCEVCHKHVPDVFIQTEERCFDDEGERRWTQHQCTMSFGHEACLRSKRREPVYADYFGLLRCIATAQHAGQVVAFLGLCIPLDQAAAVAAGVRLGDLLISHPDTDEVAIEVAETLLRTGVVALVAIDAQGPQGMHIYQALSGYGAAVAVGSQD